MSDIQIINPDALGKALYDYYYYDPEGPCVIERDDGYTDNAELGQYFSDYPEWESITQLAIDKLNTGKVLDIGCGAGRHSLHLNQKGNNTIPVDKSPLLVSICRDRGLDQSLIMDIDNPVFRNNVFDSILIVGDIIGLGQNLVNIKNRLIKLAEITSDDAMLLFDSQDPTYVDEHIHKSYYKNNQIKDSDASRIKFRVKYNGIVDDWMNIIFLSPEELDSIVEDTPWKLTEILSPDDRSNWYSLNHGWYFGILEKSP